MQKIQNCSQKTWNAWGNLLEIAERLRSGELDLIFYLSSLCDRIDALDPIYEAIVPDTYNRSQILQDGLELLQRFPDPATRPIMFGLPVGIKDIMFTERWPTLCNSALPNNLWDPREDSAGVRLLYEAGAVIMLKAHTTEFAVTGAPPTKNPWDLTRSPGGSSAGSGAGTATPTGFFPFALGTQTLGSIGIPSSYNGVVGFLPTYGRVDGEGIMPVSVSLDHMGAFSQRVEDMRLIAPVLVQNWNQKLSQRLNLPQLKNDFVFGIPCGAYLDQLTDNGEVHFEYHISLLQQNGFQIRRVSDVLSDLTYETNAARMMNGELARVHQGWFNEYIDLYGVGVRNAILDGLNVTDQELGELRNFQSGFQEYLRQQMVLNGIDFWLVPATIDHAPIVGQPSGGASMNIPWSLSWQPIMTVPMRLDSENLPITLQIIGRHNDDERLLAVSEIVDSIFHDLE